MTKREYGIKGITPWVNASRQWLGAVTVSDIVKKIEKESPTFLENFGSSYKIAIDSTNQILVDDALAKLGRENKGQVSTYPDGSWRGIEFFDVLYNRTTQIDLPKAKIIASQVANDVKEGAKNVLMFGSMGVFLALGLGLGIYLLLREGRNAHA